MTTMRIFDKKEAEKLASPLRWFYSVTLFR